MNICVFLILFTLLRRLQSIQKWLCAWSLEPRSLITSHQCYKNFTGCRSASALRASLSHLVYKCLHNAAPVYLSSDCVPVSSLARRRQLRSSVIGTLEWQSADKNCSWSSCIQSVWRCWQNCVLQWDYCYCVSWHFWQTTENLLVR